MLQQCAGDVHGLLDFRDGLRRRHGQLCGRRGEPGYGAQRPLPDAGLQATGGAGSDRLQGGNLDDTIIGSTGNDTLDGGTGTNTIDYSSLTTPGLFAIIQGGGGTVNKGGANGIGHADRRSDLIDNGAGRGNGDVFYVDAADDDHGQQRQLQLPDRADCRRQSRLRHQLHRHHRVRVECRQQHGQFRKRYQFCLSVRLDRQRHADAWAPAAAICSAAAAPTSSTAAPTRPICSSAVRRHRHDERRRRHAPATSTLSTATTRSTAPAPSTL